MDLIAEIRMSKKKKRAVLDSLESYYLANIV